MKIFYVIFALLISVLLSACAQTSAIMLDNTATYPPSDKVEILMTPPSRPYAEIAVLETAAPVGTPLTDLLENMRQKAKALGADAVIPTQDASERTPQQLFFNPWLGGYQTLGGQTAPRIRGLAIKYK